MQTSKVMDKTSIRNKICFILDFDGYFVNGTFQVREMGYYVYDGNYNTLT